MKIEILNKKSGDRRLAEDVKGIVLDHPSVIMLKLAPEKVARFERRGEDLVLVLKDGQEIAIPGFFVKYPEGDTDQGHADVGNGAADAAAEEGRNELVLIDDQGVAWWGQYPEQWSEFHFTEIEWNDGAGFIWWPWLLGALGGGAAIAARPPGASPRSRAPASPSAPRPISTS